MIRVVSVDNSNKKIASFVTFPRIAMNRNTGDLQKPLSNISCLFFQLSQPIFFIIVAIQQSCRKLYCKPSSWRSKVSNENNLGSTSFLLNYRYNLNPVHSRASLSSSWPVSSLIIFDNFISNRICNVFYSKPFGFERSFL